MSGFRTSMAGVLAGLVMAAMVTSPAASAADEAPLTQLALPPGTMSSRAVAVNDEGTVVGGIEFSDGMLHPVKWDAGGRITILATMPYNTEAIDVDGRGVIFGYWLDEHDFVRAVVWDRAGNLIQLPSLAPGFTALMGGNATGTLVGRSADAGGKEHAVSWDRHWRVTDLGMRPGDTSSGAEAINDAGVIVGWSQSNLATVPVMWDQRGRIRELASNGAPIEWAFAVNNAGTMLGLATDLEFRNYSAVRWDRSGRLSNLGLPFGATSVRPVGLNEHGTIVGTASFGPDSDLSRGVRWDRHDHVVELGVLSPTDHGEVHAINDRDVTVGISQNPTTTRAVYWDRMGRVHAMASLPGYYSSSPWSVNDDGLVAGFCQDATTGHTRAVLWRIGD